MTPPASPSPTPSPLIIAEVRYSLPLLLKELEIERATGSLAMEKLDQVDIAKLFKARAAPRRVKSKK